MVPFTVSSQQIDDVSVITVTGELDALGAPELADVLDALELDQPVILDLAAVSFLDSSGLSTLVTMAQAVADADCSLRVVMTHPRVLRTLDISGLADTFDLYDELDEALDF